MSVDSQTCVNIGRQGINQRRMLGIWCLFLAVIGAVLLIVNEQPPWVRMLVFIPFFFGFLGLIQATRRTCVFLGLKGKQNLDLGAEDILVPRTKDILKLRSYSIILSSALLAAVCTAVTVVAHW